jgi:hypothetical protein
MSEVQVVPSEDDGPLDDAPAEDPFETHVEEEEELVHGHA